MNKKNRWKVSSLLSGALALLGFAGCSSDEPEPLLYGSPSVDYRIVGTVTDALKFKVKPASVIALQVDCPKPPMATFSV